jgi:anti-sigma factor RsiW
VSDNAAPPAPPPESPTPGDEHSRAQAHFSELIDGTLAQADKTALEQHLAGCPACQGELEAFRQTMAALRGAARSADTPSPEFMTSLREQIRTRSRGRFFGGRRPTRRLEIASLVTLIIATTVYIVLKMAQPLLFLK